MSWRSVVVLTVKDVIAAGLGGVVVLGEHPRQGPDDHRVDGEDVPQVFVQDRILQDEPAEKTFVILKIQPRQVVFLLLFSLTKQAKPQLGERKKE